VKSEGLVCDVLGAYINCLEPSNVLMDARAEDLPRAISLGAELGAKALIAWTGTFGQGLMSFDKRNLDTDNLDKIRSFLEPHTKALKEARLSIALETYITLACPDANMLFDLLKKMPSCFGAVLDPPNMTPLAGFEKRDEVMRYMVSLLKDRIRVIHLKDFKLAADQRSYELPGPLDGVMNYPLYLELIRGLKSDAPIIAEHVGPERYTEVRTRLMPLL
jgi:sugar phosphate isomerase/epimerase